MRKHLLFISFFIFTFLLFPIERSANEANKKIGVVASEYSESYALITRPGGTYNKQTVAKKVAFSSIKNKRIKTTLFLQSLGFDVELINDKQLTNPDVLKKFDTIYFPDTVMMSSKQREAVTSYIKNGGGVIAAFAFARNDADHYPYSSTQMDLSALIYHTKTWIWEWDNVSEPLQSAFVNDVIIGDYSGSSTGKHTIITNSLKELHSDKLSFENKRNATYGVGDWVEVISPYAKSKVTPLLTYNKIGHTSSAKDTPAGTGAAYAMEYGKGRMVWIGFQISDYLSVPNHLSTEWEAPPRGEAWGALSGEEHLKVFLDQSIQWTAAKQKTKQVINRNTIIELSKVSAYPRANDYIVYGTMQATNKGNVVNRGTMKAEIINPLGTVVASYQKEVVGIVPGGQSYPEKLNFSLPKNLKEGNYLFRVTYSSGKQGSQKIISGKQIVLSIPKRTQTAKVLSSSFTDVPTNHWAHIDITQLSHSGIINGYNNRTFKPEQTITRLQAATILTKTLNLQTTNRPNPNLKDVKKGQYGYDVVATVIDSGIFSGNNGYFHPNQPLTREQMAKVLVHAFKLTGESSITFTDLPKSAWSHEYIATLLANDVTQVQGTFRPYEKTTRAQFATFVRRASLASIK